MADLTDQQAAQTVKIIGSDSTGVEQTPAQSTANGALHTNLRNNAGTEIGVAATPIRVDTTGTTIQPVSGTVTSKIQDSFGSNLSSNAGSLFVVGGDVAGISNTQRVLTVQGAGIGSVPHQVDVSTSTLPTGASTLSEQQTQTTSLGTINTSVNTLLKPSSTLNAVNTLGSISNALPAGANVIGQVIANAGTNLNTSNLAVETTQVTQNTRIGDLIETAPVSDIGSSGLNGRLQRIAQRISSLIGLFPTSVGQKTMADSLAVTLASDQVSTSNGGLHINLRNSAGTEIGTLANALVVTSVANIKLTYSASAVGLVAGSTATDIFTITGSASKVIKIAKIYVSATASTATRDVFLIKRSTDNTGGTSTNKTIVANDSANAAGTAVVRAYTVNPTLLGTLVGIIRSRRMQILATNVTAPFDSFLWEFGGTPGTSAVVLRGINEVLSINLNGITISGNIFSIDVEWTEE